MSSDSTGSKKWVFSFAEGDGKNKKLLGGKGANLCEMTRIGLNVPPGFVITTEACLAFLDDAQRALPFGVMDEVRMQLLRVETASGKVNAWHVTLQSVSVGGISVDNVEATVVEGDYPSKILLGMTFLRHVKMEETDGVLSLSRAW